MAARGGGFRVGRGRVAIGAPAAEAPGWKGRERGAGLYTSSSISSFSLSTRFGILVDGGRKGRGDGGALEGAGRRGGRCRRRGRGGAGRAGRAGGAIGVVAGGHGQEECESVREGARPRCRGRATGTWKSGLGVSSCSLSTSSSFTFNLLVIHIHRLSLHFHAHTPVSLMQMLDMLLSSLSYTPPTPPPTHAQR